VENCLDGSGNCRWAMEEFIDLADRPAADFHILETCIDAASLRAERAALGVKEAICERFVVVFGCTRNRCHDATRASAIATGKRQSTTPNIIKSKIYLYTYIHIYIYIYIYIYIVHCNYIHILT